LGSLEEIHTRQSQKVNSAPPPIHFTWLGRSKDKYSTWPTSMVNDNIVHNCLSISPEFLQTAVLVLGSLGLHGTKVHGSINEVVHTPKISFISHTVEATWLVTWNGTTASSPLLCQLAQCPRTIRYIRAFVWNLAICYGCRKLQK